MNLILTNIPDFNEKDTVKFINRATATLNKILPKKYRKIHSVELSLYSSKKENNEKEKFSILAQEPLYSFEQIILEPSTLKELNYAIRFESVKNKVYNEWGLAQIEPNPKLALNFHGTSGTGKTMAAHGLAKAMRRKIILVSYAELESKYHGDGPKNVKKFFQIASENNAVLFIDEADSLLSKRLTNITQGSEQAINSMRSQLLIQIEQFNGVVIFATNLAQNYDKAFVTRIRSIHFKKPTLEMRKKLWQAMLLPQLPLDKGINVNELAVIDDICGRDIKNAIIKAAVTTAIDDKLFITEELLIEALKDIKKTNYQITSSSLLEEEKEAITTKVKAALSINNSFHPADK
ncbi:MAG: ATP-binding protein [Spirochaetaceae bacterium]|nr:ATP-binding protein [Spirochaetaceae bacterium]